MLLRSPQPQPCQQWHGESRSRHGFKGTMPNLVLRSSSSNANVLSSNLTGKKCFIGPIAHDGNCQAKSISSSYRKWMQVRLVSCKFYGSSFRRMSDGGYDSPCSHISRFQATRVETSTVTVDIWTDDVNKEMCSIERDRRYKVLESGTTQPENGRIVQGETYLIDSENKNDGFGSIPLAIGSDNLQDGGTTSEEPKCSSLMFNNDADMDMNTAKYSESRTAVPEDIKEIQSRGFWKIVQNDIKLLKEKFKWFKEDALPSIAENVEQIVTLRVWEDSSAVKVSESQPPRPHYPGLSTLELLVADALVLKGYYGSVIGWLMTWRVPLEPVYDPDKIAAYFNRRPHVLLFRLVQVYAVFATSLVQFEIEKFLRPFNPNLDDEAYAQRKGAELLKEALTMLGPTFVKVGQSLSTRSDLIGADAAKVLSELQDNLPPFPTHKAISIIEAELGIPLNSIFSYLSEMPVAAASFGQVYKGRTIDGQEVAVKVQRPNLLHSIALDIYILRMGLALLRKIAKRRSDLKLYADELGQGLFGELDYAQEATNAAEFKEAHSKLTFLKVPRPISGLSTRKVLTMEWINGDRPGEMFQIASLQNNDGDVELRKQQLNAKQRLFSMVNKGIEASLVQLLDTGILHADPHPGNMLYTKEGELVLLDFGLLCRMEKRHQLAMLGAVVHIVNADWKNFVQDLTQMDVLPAYVDRRLIALELEQALGDAVPQDGIPDIKFSKVLGKVLSVALRNQFKMPPYFILVLRSIASLEGLALTVDPDFKVFAASYPYVLQRLLVDNSPSLRRILFSFILNGKKQFRWDRVASSVTLARQHIMKRIALETGKELEPVTLPDFDMKNTDPELISLLVNVLVSERGAAFRQLILESDTYDLAQAFISTKAAFLRRNVAMKIADVLYQYGRTYLKEHFRIDLQEPETLDTTTIPSSIEWSQQAKSLSDKAFTDNIKSLLNCSDTIDFSFLKSKHMQFLLQTLVSRLRRRPLLLLHTSWKLLTVVSYALACAAHKIVVAACFKYLETNPDKPQRSGQKLCMA